MVKTSPSGSLTLAAQNNVLLVTIAVFGVIVMLLRLGAVFSTMMLALEVFCSEAVSVAVMVHSMMSVGWTTVLLRDSDGEVPITLAVRVLTHW